MKRKTIILGIVIAAAFSLHHGNTRQPLLNAVNDKDIQNSLPDPNRPYYDACGSKFDYQGNLLEAGAGCVAEVPPLEDSFRGK